ncbi:MAG: hypothetical protein H6682_15440 [Candidatus Eisenbacteria bacterium]|nr:hypothetical protein [Candidatus Eisenbacteria bacterium]
MARADRGDNEAVAAADRREAPVTAGAPGDETAETGLEADKVALAAERVDSTEVGAPGRTEVTTAGGPATNRAAAEEDDRAEDAAVVVVAVSAVGTSSTA